MIHGNPTWSFLHRHMVTSLAAAGCRAVAVDLVGLGRSDKPAQKEDYTLARHVDWITRWFEANRFEEVTLYCQDWGGHIGLIVAAEHPEWFRGLVPSNTGLPEGRDQSEFLAGWIAMMQGATSFPWEVLTGTMGEISDEVYRAYLAPFPDERYMAGILQFPLLIADPSDNPGVPQCRAAWEKLERFDKPVLTLFGDSDPVSAGMDRVIQARIPGARGQDHQVIEGGGHFIQEHYSDQLVPHILRFVGVH